LTKRLLEDVDRRVVDGVEAALLHQHVLAGQVADEAEVDAVELGRTRPVVGEGHQLVQHAGLALAPGEGARAHRVVAHVVVDRLGLDASVRHDVGLVVDGTGGRLHEQAQEEGAGAHELDRHLERTGDADVVGRDAGAQQLGRGEVQRQHPLQAEGDVLGREDVAVVERHPVADLEHEGAAVVGDGPRLRQPGLVVGGADHGAVVLRGRLVADERVVEVVGHPGGGRVRADVRVHAGRLEVDAEVEHVLCLGARHEQGDGERQRLEQPDHRVPPPYESCRRTCRRVGVGGLPLRDV
jgi:hypothetical protein